MNASLTMRFDGEHGTVVVRRFDSGRVSESPERSQSPERPERPAFVLVHGIGVSWRYFCRLIPQLQRHGDVYALDLPGFGSAPTPPHDRPLSVEDFAELVADCVASLGLGSAVFVGHSMGTQIVTELAASRPHAVDAAILLGPVVDTHAKSALAQGARLAIDVFREPPGANRIVISDYLRCGIRWYLTQLPAMLDYDIVERLSTVTVPVVIVRGAGDSVAPERWVDELAAVVPHARAVTVPRAAHVVQYARPVQVAQAILQAVPRSQSMALE